MVIDERVHATFYKGLMLLVHWPDEKVYKHLTSTDVKDIGFSYLLTIENTYDIYAKHYAIKPVYTTIYVTAN